MAEQDDNLFHAALTDIARAHGMTRLAKEIGLYQETLYRSLESDAKPRFGTIYRIMRGFDISLSTTPLARKAGTGTILTTSNY